MTDDPITTTRLVLRRRDVLSAIAATACVRHAIAAGKPASYVLVVPSTHKRLAGNPHYNYADLYALVKTFRPDLVGVEIRQEDLGRPDSYLRHSYPEEMVALARAYNGRVFGFDWLGDELSGRAIPDDWWTKQSHIKQLERTCNAAPPDKSPALTKLNARLDALSLQQDKIIETATAASLADGRYDSVTASYYQTAAELTRGTPCEELPKRYAERDHQIAANIVGQVRQNPGRRIAVVTGVDHHGPVVAALSSLGSSIVFVAVQDDEQTPLSAVTEYEAATGGHVGIYAENVVSGARLEWRADERFVMCSTFKASLAALILSLVDRGEEQLNTPIPYTAADLQEWYAPVAKANLSKGVLSVGEMCRAAVEQSDNTCANLLLARVGGPAALTSFWRACGDSVSRLDDTEPLLNRTPLGDDRNTTTPRAMAENFKRFILESALSPSSRLHLKTWLIGSVTGFNRLRAGLPASWVVGDKTGNNGEDAAGDVAIAWSQPGEPILICAYTRGGAPDQRRFRDLFSALGRAAVHKCS